MRNESAGSDFLTRTARARSVGASQRDHRLDGARKRARPASRARQAHPAQAWLPAGQAGEGDADSVGAGGGAVRRMGDGMKSRCMA